VRAVTALSVPERRVDRLWRWRPLQGLAFLAVTAGRWLVAIAMVIDDDGYGWARGGDVPGELDAAREGAGAPPVHRLAALVATARPVAVLPPLAGFRVRRRRRGDGADFRLAWADRPRLVTAIVVTEPPSHPLATSAASAR